MNISEEAKQEFVEIARQLIKWLNENAHPHTVVIVDLTSAQLLEGAVATYTEDFLKG